MCWTEKGLIQIWTTVQDTWLRGKVARKQKRLKTASLQLTPGGGLHLCVCAQVVQMRVCLTSKTRPSEKEKLKEWSLSRWRCKTCSRHDTTERVFFAWTFGHMDDRCSPGTNWNITVWPTSSASLTLFLICLFQSRQLVCSSCQFQLLVHPRRSTSLVHLMNWSQTFLSRWLVTFCLWYTWVQMDVLSRTLETLWAAKGSGSAMHRGARQTTL